MFCCVLTRLPYWLKFPHAEHMVLMQGKASLVILGSSRLPSTKDPSGKAKVTLVRQIANELAQYDSFDG